MDVGQGAQKLTGMSSAMVEHKKPQRRMPSGCAGIFCQLFHWNSTSRMSAKKKLHHLSSGSGSGMLHSSSKRFRGAAPNSYPIVNGFGGCMSTMDVLLHQNRQMKAPTLVAKLMGLDSIPTALNTQNQPKHKPEPSHLHASPRIGDKPAHPRGRRPKNEPQLLKRPSKMGRFDVARCGGQAASLQLKNVLLCSSTKHHYHHANFPTPLKRTSVSSGGNNAARLTGAAVKTILEPGSRVTKSKASAITQHFEGRDLNQQGVPAGTRTAVEHKSAFHSTEHRYCKLSKLGNNRPMMLIQPSNAFGSKHGKTNKLHFVRNKIHSGSKHGNWQCQSPRRMLKKNGNVRFDVGMEKSSSITQTTPERKRRMFNGNEKLKNSVFTSGKMQGQGNGEVCPKNQSLARYKTETPLHHRSSEKAHCLLPTDKGSTLGLMQSVSFMLDKLGHHGMASAKKLIHFKDVILRIGPLLENEMLNKPTGGNKFFICHFFSQLEIIADAMWTGSIAALPGFWKLKSRNQLLWILFDLAVEYLDSRFGNNSELELGLWMGLPIRVTVQQLMLGLNSEIAKWANLRGKNANKVVEWEVSHSSEILTDYETEARKVCCELDEYLLKGLVEEIVMEVYEINLVQNYSKA